ncbi:FAM3 metabolism regulating signaling molecule A [Phyllostomus discolor]|uniref:FAM3 metabolism regulating signaling molecule A n=1 Tax=Phyllostomus discolor TaxID=89673 RepID=A0A833ZCX0_9CHIR|nr:FAM3 metabolism regulating signaling molecule A [Phyllostomus discolor]
MRLAGPLRIVVLVVTVGLTWIVVSILLGGPGNGFPRIQQLFTSPENSVTAGKAPVTSLLLLILFMGYPCLSLVLQGFNPPFISPPTGPHSLLQLLACVNLENMLPASRILW